MYRNIRRQTQIHTENEVKYLLTLPNKFGLKVINIGKGCKYKTMNAYKLSDEKDTLSNVMLIEQKDTKLEITTKWHKDYLLKPCTFIFDLNEEINIIVSGQQTFAHFNKAADLPRATEYNNPQLDNWFDETKGKYVCSARPILDYNRKYNCTELKDCYEYDINSAYTSTMLEHIPDLHHPLSSGKVLKNQIGFLFDDNMSLIHTGYYADIRFDLIETPKNLKEYCINWYKKKKEATNLEDKIKAKAYLNLPIGYCQRYNPFFRAYVVNSCNEKIRKLINDDTLFWNTDAIFSKTKRTDLDIGVNVGQFKEIHADSLRYCGNTYQINNEFPVYRGVPKKWFNYFEIKNGRPFNLLFDKLPERFNVYSWDSEKLELRRN